MIAPQCSRGPLITCRALPSPEESGERADTELHNLLEAISLMEGGKEGWRDG